MDILQAYAVQLRLLLESHRGQLARGVIADAESLALLIQQEAENLVTRAEERHARELRSVQHYTHPRIRAEVLRSANVDLSRSKEAAERFLKEGLERVREDLQTSLRGLGK